MESSKEETLKEQIEWITNWMRNFQKPLFVCSGNHDIEELENEDWLSKITNVYSDNAIKTFQGVKFGYIPYIAPDFFEFEECEVILFHLPPAKTKTAIDKSTNADWGDKEIARLLQKNILKPKILLCGHMHHPIDMVDKINRTTIYNTGVYQEKKLWQLKSGFEFREDFSIEDEITLKLLESTSKSFDESFRGKLFA